MGNGYAFPQDFEVIDLTEGLLRSCRGGQVRILCHRGGRMLQGQLAEVVFTPSNTLKFVFDWVAQNIGTVQQPSDIWCEVRLDYSMFEVGYNPMNDDAMCSPQEGMLRIHCSGDDITVMYFPPNHKNGRGHTPLISCPG